jgi:hypothetical protein
MRSRPHLLELGCALVLALGCGGAPKARSAAGERLPANGAPGDKPASELPSKTIARADWEKVQGERLAPTCDAHEGVRTADASSLAGADKVLGSWGELRAAKGKSATASGKKANGTFEPTRHVGSVGMTCAAGSSMLLVNGVRYPFDLAWVVTGEGKGRTLNGDLGAGRFVMIEALSFADQRVVFTKVFVPSDANDDTDDIVVVASLAGYLPENPDVPIVHVVSDPEDPKLETFILSKGAPQPTGISLQVPNQDPLGRARYLGLARFDVAP